MRFERFCSNLKGAKESLLLIGVIFREKPAGPMICGVVNQD